MGRFNNDPWTVAIDFDGTIRVGTKYDPDEGPEDWELSPGFIEFYYWAVFNQLRLVVFSSRDMSRDNEFQKIVSFFREKHLYRVIVPRYEFHGAVLAWVGYRVGGSGENGFLLNNLTGPKMYADFYVDDLSVGCPKTEDGYVSWPKVGNLIRHELDNLARH